MSGCDGQRTGLGFAETTSDLPQDVPIVQHALCDAVHFSSWGTETGQAATLPLEQRYSQFIFEDLQMFAQARLGLAQFLGRTRDVEIIAHHCVEDLQAL
jgi:hypothetical protein